MTPLCTCGHTLIDHCDDGARGYCINEGCDCDQYTAVTSADRIFAGFLVLLLLIAVTLSGCTRTTPDLDPEEATAAFCRGDRDPLVLKWGKEHHLDCMDDQFPLDAKYAREVACGMSPVRMVGDAERVARWQRTHTFECTP